MKIYTVGGFVRDSLLKSKGYSITPVDRDWVVVGSTPQELLHLGFIPVGSDFPVFLHPKTHEEYALARTERKAGHGYHGFTFLSSPDVSLEEDLIRRDLTINAIAMDEKGQIFDPFLGQNDLNQKLLKHVSDAFKEDPVRVLRVARFQAKLFDFSIHPETKLLMKDMVESGEVDHLVPERVFQEFSKGFGYSKPSLMLRTLLECGAWSRLFPLVPITNAQLQQLDLARNQNFSLAQMFSILTNNVSRETDIDVCFKSIRLSREIADLMKLVQFLLNSIGNINEPSDLAKLLQKIDTIRRPNRVLAAIECLELLISLNKKRWVNYIDAFLSIDAGEISQSVPDKKNIPIMLMQARIQQLEPFFKAEN